MLCDARPPATKTLGSVPQFGLTFRSSRTSNTPLLPVLALCVCRRLNSNVGHDRPPFTSRRACAHCDTGFTRRARRPLNTRAFNPLPTLLRRAFTRANHFPDPRPTQRPDARNPMAPDTRNSPRRCQQTVLFKKADPIAAAVNGPRPVHQIRAEP